MNKWDTVPPWQMWGGILLLATLCHLPFLLLGTYKYTYDTYTHLFFASHWMGHWWQDFEPRWYAGFSVFLYPPFSHQLLALPAKVFNLELTYIVVQMLTIFMMVVGMYRYTRIWFSHQTGLLAAMILIGLSSLAMTIHLFGQYPNTVSLALILNVAPFLRRWVFLGYKKDLAISLCLMAPLVFTSLFSNFFGIVFFMLPIFGDFVLLNSRYADVLADDEDADFLKIQGSGWRLLAVTVLIAMLALFCLSPFFYYLKTHPFEQMQIPHGSRNNVLLFNLDNFVMFYGLYGVFLPLLPVVIQFIWRQKRPLVFLPSMLMLALFSTGGATPLNKLLLGGLFDVITFDRFSLWNTILMTPLVAHLLVTMLANKPSNLLQRLGKSGVLISLTGAYLALFYIGAAAIFWKPLPKVLDLTEIKHFLEQPGMEQYRFITLGFGGNNLSALTSRTHTPTLDGNYNFARRIVELNQAPIALLDEAKYYGFPAIEALGKFLLHPAKYNLKHVLLLDQYYVPLLRTAGWQRMLDLTDNVELWEPTWAVPPIQPQSPPNSPWPLRLIWGLLPLSSFVLALVLIGYFYGPWKLPGLVGDDSA